jgi:hypothetical protein
MLHLGLLYCHPFGVHGKDQSQSAVLVIIGKIVNIANRLFIEEVVIRLFELIFIFTFLITILDWAIAN